MTSHSNQKDYFVRTHLSSILTASIGFLIMAGAYLTTKQLDAIYAKNETEKALIRSANLTSIVHAIKEFRAQNDGKFPAISPDTAFCLGRSESQNCWQESPVKISGNAQLNDALSPYTKIPQDPAPTRGIGDSYLYFDGTQLDACTGDAKKTKGQFVLWVPNDPPKTSAACTPHGISTCCNPICVSYCALKLD